MRINYLLVLVLALLVAGAVGNQPVPNCTMAPFWKTLPLTPFENYRVNLDDLLKGYNMAYTLEGDNVTSDIINLESKFEKNAEQTPLEPLVGLKSYHLDQAGNGWGEGFIALTEVGAKTSIHYGLLADNKSAPAINNKVQVENEANITCFDAVLFPAKDLIVVDCMLKLGKPGPNGKLFQNRFVYVRLGSGTILPNHVDTEMYVPFTQVTRRRLLTYVDPESGYHYLLRSYFADGVSSAHSLNTYVDVFILNDPSRPWSLKVIDRTLLQQSQLSIMDIQMYLGDIYLLDNRKGLYRMDITVHQQLIITGRYQAQGFTRFGVYSNDLDDAFEIALANSHSVYEIDWSRTSSPILLTKYSLLPNSDIQQVALNEDYLIVQSFTKVNTSGGVQQYNYTWVFNRGDRSYNRAFKVINHNTIRTAISLNRQQSYLLVIDDESLTNYAIRQPILSLNPRKEDPAKLNIPYNLTIRATSMDPLSNERKVCLFVLNFTLVLENNRTMWPSGYTPNTEFSANYPGRLEIPLFEYVLGPNITYEVRPSGQGDPPDQYYVLQQNQLRLHWQYSPGMIATRFIKTEQFANFGNETLIIYLQDYTNVTYVSLCSIGILSLDMYCNDTITEDIGGALKFFATALFESQHTLQYHHMIAYSTEEHGNRIFINDNTARRRLAELDFEDGFAGTVSSIEITGRFLFVVQRFIKTILVYSLDRCLEGDCTPVYKIDVFMMYKLGVKYFNPLEVYTSIFHPEVIFIRTPNSVLVLDAGRQGKPTLLGEVVSDATSKHDTPFKVAVNFDYLIIANSPSLIEEYALDQLYKGRIIHTKNYPLYQFVLPAQFDLDISDQGDAIYFTTEGPTGLKDVFVYRAGYPNVGSLYDVIPLGSYRDMLVDVTGSIIDFVTVVSGNVIRVFKQYELPVVVVENIMHDYTFEIEYYNVERESGLARVNVQVQNWPTSIKVNDYYKDIMNTRDMFYSGKDRLTEFDDEGWYKGNVLQFKAECPDCGDKVIIKNHVHEERQVLATTGLHEYQWGFDGGSIQQSSNLIHMKHNGDVDQIVNHPQADWGEVCFRIAVPLVGSYHVSACRSTRGMSLYLTSFISSKGFSWGPWPSGAKSCTRLDVVRELIMLVDTDPQPGLFSRPGGVFIYAINTDPSDQDHFTELEYLDSDDFGGVSGWDDSQTAYIANAEMTYTYETDTYRVLMTELRGLFVIDFNWRNDRDQISIKRINFVDLHKVLTTAGYRMPYDANFQAVTVVTSFYDHFNGIENQTLLLTTGRFHTFQFEMLTDKGGSVMSIQVTRVYLRYSFYHVNNYVRHFDDFMVISQTIPDEFAWQDNYNRQILTIYHTKGAFNGTIERRELRGAYILGNRQPYNYDFNWTYFNRQNGSDLSRVGLLLVDPLSNSIKQLSMYKDIQLITKEQLETQVIKIDLINDFSVEKIRIYLHGTKPYPEWKIVLIVVMSIVGAGILGAVGFFVFKFVKARRSGGFEQTRASLMTDSNS